MNQNCADTISEKRKGQSDPMTMTRKEMNVRLSAILTTLADTGPASETICYLAIGANLNDWNELRHILLAGDLVTIKWNEVAITEKGRELAAKIMAAFEVDKALANKANDGDGTSALTAPRPGRKSEYYD